MRKIKPKHVAQIVSYILIFAGMSWLRAITEGVEPPKPIWIVWVLASGFVAGSVGWKLHEIVTDEEGK